MFCNWVVSLCRSCLLTLTVCQIVGLEGGIAGMFMFKPFVDHFTLLAAAGMRLMLRTADM